MRGGGGGGEELRGPDDHVISRHSETPYDTTFKLSDFYFLSISHILDEFKQNRSNKGLLPLIYQREVPPIGG